MYQELNPKVPGAQYLPNNPSVSLAIRLYFFCSLINLESLNLSPMVQSITEIDPKVKYDNCSRL